jgi:hypothetical protein
MADAPPAHRGEQTGDPALDRIQNNVRALIEYLKRLAASLTSLESDFHRTYGAGIVRIPMNNADLTLLADDARFLYGQLVLTGAHTATRTLVLPDATDATAYHRWLVNQTGQIVTVKTKDGSFNLPNGAHYAVWVSVSGPSAESTG